MLRKSLVDSATFESADIINVTNGETNSETGAVINYNVTLNAKLSQAVLDDQGSSPPDTTSEGTAQEAGTTGPAEGEPDSDGSPQERDTVRVNDINSLSTSLESYFNSNTTYPDQINATVLGAENNIFSDPDGNQINVSIVSSAGDAGSPYSSQVPDGAQYTYYAYGCENDGGCSGYSLWTWREASEPYNRGSLN